MFTPNIIPNKREMTRNKVSFDAVCFLLVLLEKKNKKKIYFFLGKYSRAENIRNSSHSMKYIVYSPQKSKYSLYIYGLPPITNAKHFIWDVAYMGLFSGLGVYVRAKETKLLVATTLA